MNITEPTRRWLTIFVVLGTFTVFVLVTSVMLLAATQTDKIDKTQDINQKINESQNQTLAQQNETLKQVKELAAEIRSCTTPDRPCAKRNQKATAEAVRAIGEANVVAAAAASACAISSKPPTYENIYACVIDTVSRATRSQSP